MIKTMLSVAVLLCFSIYSFADTKNINNINIIDGDGVHFISVSLKDISRISCPVEVGDPIFSKEKEIEISKYGKELFIKVSPKQVVYSNGKKELIYSDMPRDLFVDCAGRIYSFTLLPKDIPSQIIIINVPLENISAAIEFEKAEPYETTIYQLIRTIYMDQVPVGYQVSSGTEELKFKEASLRLKRSYIGYNYIVEDWVLTSHTDEISEFNEQVFIPYIKKPRALTIISPMLTKTEQTRLIVVRDK